MEASETNILLKILCNSIAELNRNTLETNDLLRSMKESSSNESPLIEDIVVGEYRLKHDKLYGVTLAKQTNAVNGCLWKHALYYFGSDCLLSAITYENVLGFRNYLESKGIRSDALWRAARSIFNKAVKLKHMNENPFNEVKPKNVQQIRKEAIEDGQLIELLHHVKNPIVRDVIVIAGYSGLRRGEVNHIYRSDINLEEKTLTVGSNKFTTKNRKQRIIPLRDESITIIKKYISKSNGSNGDRLLFCKSNGKPYSDDYISRSFLNAKRDAGIEGNITLHSVRHAHATNLSREGVPPHTIKTLLGHSSIKTTERYLHETKESLRKGIDKLNH